MYSPKVSVIIPVYNVEEYIIRCACSLFEQTLDDIEFIFVDDYSTDRSIDLMLHALEEYPNRMFQVKLIRHENNQGVSKSRQDGVDESTGEYIIHCDPDDWVERDIYEILYSKARQTNADIVICDYYYNDDISQKVVSQRIKSSGEDIIFQAANGEIHMGLCNKLIKKSYLIKSGVRLQPEISLWEDMSITVPLLIGTKKISKVDVPLYHYRIDSRGSIVKKKTRQSILSQIKALEYITTYLTEKLGFHNTNKALGFLQLRAKDQLLIKGDTFDISLWRNLFKYSHRHILTLPLPLGRKLIYTLAVLNLSPLVRMLASFRKWV